MADVVNCRIEWQLCVAHVLTWKEIALLRYNLLLLNCGQTVLTSWHRHILPFIFFLIETSGN